MRADRVRPRGLRDLGLLAALLLAASWLPGREARAAEAVGLQTWDTLQVEESIGSAEESLTASDVPAQASSMAGNEDLHGSAWAHTGAFWVVHVQHFPEVQFRVDAASPSDLAPGLSVWATGDTVFDGGTTSFGGETSSAAFGTPHSFNAFGALGDPGTLWMQDGQGGNAQELLGYAISGPSWPGPGGWGETIENGAHDVRTTSDYASGVSGSTGAGFAELALHHNAPGWYLVYVGGTDHSLEGGPFDLTIQVPEPGAVPMAAAAALALLALCRARRAPCRPGR